MEEEVVAVVTWGSQQQQQQQQSAEQHRWRHCKRHCRSGRAPLSQVKFLHLGKCRQRSALGAECRRDRKSIGSARLAAELECFRQIGRIYRRLVEFLEEKIVSDEATSMLMEGLSEAVTIGVEKLVKGDLEGGCRVAVSGCLEEEIDQAWLGNEWRSVGKSHKERSYGKGPHVDDQM